MVNLNDDANQLLAAKDGERVMLDGVVFEFTDNTLPPSMWYDGCFLSVERRNVVSPERFPHREHASTEDLYVCTADSLDALFPSVFDLVAAIANKQYVISF